MAEFEGMRDEVARNLTVQMGKPLQQSQNEVGGLLGRTEHMADIAEAVLADEWLPEKPGFKRHVRHEPLGVVLDIAALNCPLPIAVNVVVPAVLAGNAVIIKHSSKTPLCGKAFVEAFRKAGAPDNLVQNVVADHKVTELLMRHPGVDRSIYDRFVEAYAATARQYMLGDPMLAETSRGPQASKGAPAFLREQVEAAVRAGGRLVVDPKEFATPSRGWFLAPTVVADAPQDCSLMQEESFGPVIGILPVSGDEEAVRLMNDSPYGLTASICTSDTDLAIRVGERIETGTFHMNRCDFLDPALPWCGVKDTGRGAMLSA